MDFQEFQESTTVRLEWTIRGLKQLFESSKGETKSKVVKSAKFAGGRWQVLFYPNSGTEGGQYVSLYLSCEPTPEEKGDAIDGRWIRAGLYKFIFELRNLSKTMLFNQKEAVDHSFSWKTANWGWAQFARRETIYYQPTTIRNIDAFLITCTISSAPATPSVPSPIPLRSVPKDLLDVVGSLIDDPAYSDVEFVFPRQKCSGSKPRRILAARSMLRRAEYFDSMFRSAFVEACSQNMELVTSQPDDMSVADSNFTPSVLENTRLFEDSDDDYEAELTEVDVDSEAEEANALHGPAESKIISGSEETTDSSETTTGPPLTDVTIDGETLPLSVPSDTVGETPSVSVLGLSDVSTPERRNVRAKLSHPSSPSQRDKVGDTDDEVHSSDTRVESGVGNGSISKSLNMRYRVVVQDVAYTTYRAVLYYLYTDSIVFAPLASTFLAPPSTTGPSSQPVPSRSQGEGQNVNTGSHTRPVPENERKKVGPTTRTEWIKKWERQNPGKPRPCSAKSAYRVADKLGLSELKARAFQHIVKSLTIHNVPYEMFSSFSSMFEEIRKTEVAFFLDHWNEIRTSQSMQTVWQQIRAGRHPGFEEVWPLIAMNLEFRPRATDATSDDNRVENGDAFAGSR